MYWMTMASVAPYHALHTPQHAAASPYGPLNRSNDFLRPSCRSRLYITGTGISRYARVCLELPSGRPGLESSIYPKYCYTDSVNSYTKAVTCVLCSIGTDHQTLEGVIGTEGVGKSNSKGLLLLRKCAEHELLIPTQSSVYQLVERHRGCTLAPNTGISLTIS